MTIRNRRFKYIQTILLQEKYNDDDEDYFSDSVIMSKWPALFKEIMGDSIENSSVNHRFGDFKDTQVNTKWLSDLLYSSVKATVSSSSKPLPIKHSDDYLIKKKELNRAVTEMFINGLDLEFDYQLVDNNEEYDDLEKELADVHEQYFDSEEPSQCNGTGIQDF